MHRSSPRARCVGATTTTTTTTKTKTTTAAFASMLSLLLLLFGCRMESGDVVSAFTFSSPIITNSAGVTKRNIRQRTICKRTKNGRNEFQQLHASIPSKDFFFSEEGEDDDEQDKGEEPKSDTRMVNGSWNNKNQFPSQSFPQPTPKEEEPVEFEFFEETFPDATTTTVTATDPLLSSPSLSSQSSPPPPPPDVPSFLSVDGNGTGGLMQRAKGTGGVNPSLMVPSDVNPNMRMVTPIDSGKETKRMEPGGNHPSTVASYAALSALTRTPSTTPSSTSQSINNKLSSSSSTSAENELNLTNNGGIGHDSLGSTTRLVPFEKQQQPQQQQQGGNTNTFLNTNRQSNTNNGLPASIGEEPPINIKVQRFRGEKSVMNEHREGFSKNTGSKHVGTTSSSSSSSPSLDQNHHINLDGNQRKNPNNNNMPKTQQQQQQHPQIHAPLNTRLVPFTGSSLMNEMNRNAEAKNEENRRQQYSNGSRLVKFNGYSMMEQQRLIESQDKSQQIQAHMLQQGHRLVPYRKPNHDGSSSSSSHNNNNNNNGGKVVLYDKQSSSLASSVARSNKRDYYYIQYRPPTDATMARKTGLQVNTPISLWNDRDKFIDSA